MAAQDKIISGVLLTHSALGIWWTIWIGSRLGAPAAFFITNLALAAIGLASGLGWLRLRHWAARLSVLFYLVQLVHVLTPDFRWSFTLGFNINIDLGWFSWGQVGINFFALIMLAWFCARAFAPDSSFKPTSLRDAA